MTGKERGAPAARLRVESSQNVIGCAGVAPCGVAARLKPPHAATPLHLSCKRSGGDRTCAGGPSLQRAQEQSRWRFQPALEPPPRLCHTEMRLP